ncbi:MAG: LysE family transporter [Nanoarchaeota archaeon]|nr:LysE family transporter [Nanoarchaeota archaeon]
MKFLIISISAFLIGFLATIIATGPVTFLVFRNSLLGRYNRAVAMVFGSSLMESIYCILALSVVSSLFLESARIQLLSRTISAIILFSIGIYLYKTDIIKDISRGVRQLTKKEKTRSFLAGFILVAINPTIILTWSAAITALISFKIARVHSLIEILFFAGFATLGMISGGLSMILLIKYFKMKFPKEMLNKVLKFIGALLVITSFYFFLSIDL